MADSQSATIASFGSEASSLKNYPLAAAFEDSTVKVIGNYLLNDSLLYFATNNGTVIMQDLESSSSEQTNLIDPQIKKVDSKHFYKSALLNSNQ